jgi:bacilysin biosynthesis oxidoreductase BacG
MTPLLESILADEAEKWAVSTQEVEAAFIEENRPNIIVRRAGTSEETAAVVAFLASARASFVTASDDRADGGSVASIS